MSDGPHRYRQFAGLLLVVVVYVGGIIGWTCAVLEVEDTTNAAAGPPSTLVSADTPARHTSRSPSAQRFNHKPFTRLLRRFVDARGNVDYEALRAQADTVLRPYLQRLASARLSSLSRDARLALWINAYNAFTLKLIVDHYPVKSIRAIEGPSPEQTPFQRPVGPVADTIRTLDEIEHEIIRKRFDEPRIHFALVCAAKSCPRLRREAYTGPQLDAQLEAQARSFLHNNRKNRIPDGNGRIALSRILKWYGADFGPTQTALQRALAAHFTGPVRDSLRQGAYEVRFLPYDWTLNDQALSWGAWSPPSSSGS